MSDKNDAPKTPNKDLTGIFQTMQASQDNSAEASPPSEHDQLKPIEQLDNFESIDQMGMMDHAPEAPVEATHTEAFSISSDTAYQQADTQTDFHEPTGVTELNPIDLNLEAEAAAPEIPTAFQTEPTLSGDVALEAVQEYAEKAQTFSESARIFQPFHLHIRGRFGPFERDKLLLFITENPIGLTSADLDLQINSGRVMIPRISEYAGIRLIQQLRDSDLDLVMRPSARDADEPVHETRPLEYHYSEKSGSNAVSFSIPILPANAASIALYDVFDSISGNQYLKVEMVEAQESQLFQEVVDRMIGSIKQKARLKGADALTHFQQKITPLRLPSQYQISIEATMLRKK
jgi:hypothetical protein